MSKPICVIRIDMDRLELGTGERPTLGIWQNIFEERLPDYHVFVLPLTMKYEEYQDVFEFQVFYEKDFTEIQYQDLKELIAESLKNTPTI